MLPTVIKMGGTDLPSLPTAITAPPPPPSSGEATDLPSLPTRIQVAELRAPSAEPPALAELPPQATGQIAEPRDAPIESPAETSVPWIRHVALAAVAAGIVAASLLAIAYWPSRPAAPTATLDITVDSPAMIAVDGKEAALGLRATVQVKAGVEHVVTVRRSGEPPRTLHVPGLAPNEHLPLTLALH
jgi:hypothetical protein